LDELGAVDRVPDRPQEAFGRSAWTDIMGIDDDALLVGHAFIYGVDVTVLNVDGSPGPGFEPMSQLATDRDWVYFVTWYDPVGPSWLKYQSVWRVLKRTTPHGANERV